MAKSKGTIKFFNTQKSFGFITPDNGNKDVFVHGSNLVGDAKSYPEGTKVEFELRDGRKGPEAANVTRI